MSTRSDDGLVYLFGCSLFLSSLGGGGGTLWSVLVIYCHTVMAFPERQKQFVFNTNLTVMIQLLFFSGVAWHCCSVVDYLLYMKYSEG